MKTITYQELIRRRDNLREINNRGVTLIFRKTRFKSLLGISLILFGILTFPLPTGSLILIPFGLYIMKNDKLNKHCELFN